MRVTVLTLFPKMFDVMKESIIGRAINNELINLEIIDFREFSKNKHKKVDDYAFGGGAGGR